jgi:hypothetical protein
MMFGTGEERLYCDRPMQASLEYIAKCGYKGTLQNDLPRVFNVKHSNYSYVLKTLLFHGLIVRTPVKLRPKAGVVISTAAIHLNEFAPDIALGSEQVRTRKPSYCQEWSRYNIS